MSENVNEVCPKCGFISKADNECPKCGIIISKYNPQRFPPENRSPLEAVVADSALTSTLSDEPENIYRIENPKTKKWALPLALGFGILLQSSWGFRMISHLTTNMPLHEMGHAIVSWLGGRKALPLPMMGFTMAAYSRSTAVIVLIHALLVAWVGYAFVKKRYYNLLFGTLFLAAAIHMSFFISEIKLTQYVHFGGVLGEVILSTLLIVSFFFSITKRYRWDFWRFPLLIYGAIAYSAAAVMWININSGLQSLPMGSAISADVADGDLSRLIAAGYTPEGIISTMLWIIRMCGIAIIATYVFTQILSQSKLKG